MELETKSFWILTAAKLFIVNLLVFLVSSQNAAEFISIDSGGDGGWDPVLQLNWTSDDAYLEAAAELRNQGVTIRAGVSLEPQLTPVENADRLKTALVFYPGIPYHDLIPRSKFCYNLPVKGPAYDYLLRATFPTSNLTPTVQYGDGRVFSFNAHSTSFYLWVDSTYVATIELRRDPQIIELIVTSISTNVFVCLVPLEDRSSMPAISALELRPLADDMYTRSFESSSGGSGDNNTGPARYLMLISRLNFGGNPDLPSVRYPQDTYDRLWYSPRIPEDQFSKVISVENTSFVDWTVANPPAEVLRTAWEGKSFDNNITFTWDLVAPRPQPPILSYYINLGFYDFASTSDVSRLSINIDVGYGTDTHFHNVVVDPFQLVYLKSWAITVDNLTFIISANDNSTLNATINYAEIFGGMNAVTARTAGDDAESIKTLSKDQASKLDIAGDPCLPVPWTWIVCSIGLPSRVTQINITRKGVSGDLLWLEPLTHLTVLDLSRNTFSGGLPESLGNLSTLRKLNLERNQLFGELPSFAIDSWNTLEFLSLASNRLNGSISALVSALGAPISHLNISNNSFTETIPMEIDGLGNLETLDLSYNNLFGELKVDLRKLSKLNTLDLSNNNLTGTVPDSIWNSLSLRTVNLGGNNFTELNLTAWYNFVKSFHDIPNVTVLLQDNPIQTIILPQPSLDVKHLDWNVYKSQGVILLGSNSPWCEKHPAHGRNLVQRFLCRSSENDAIYYLTEISVRTLVASITVAVLAAILCCVLGCLLRRMAIFLRRMRQRSRELDQIHEALAQENVKPPIFSYDELKTATGSFSESNILGAGGFGTVFKAEMSDGTILAVKRLLATKQNASDFLKEMVSITGIKHRHLIQLKGCCLKANHQRMLVYEYAENGNLAEALWGPEKPLVLSWQQRFNICLGIARGLSYLHEELQPKMVHRDIKPQNILLDNDYNAKIADFGLIRPAKTDSTQVTFNIGGTRGYCSPEYMNDGIVSEKLDVFSFGVVVLEIVSGRACIDNRLPPLRDWAMDLYEQGTLLTLVDKELMGMYNEEEVRLVLQMAMACCQFDWKKRPTMSQVVTTLMKHADVAIEVVRQLRGTRPNLEKILEIDMEGVPTTDARESEFSGLLSMNSTNLSNPSLYSTALSHAA